MEASHAITVNGERREAPQGATVADLLRDLNLPAGRVAVERNLEILPRPSGPIPPFNPATATKSSTS